MNTKTKTIIIKKISVGDDVSIKDIDFSKLKLSSSLQTVFRQSIVSLKTDDEFHVFILSCVAHLFKDKHFEQLKEAIENYYDKKVEIDVFSK